jgi:SSS family solute:Na+ symporter
MLATLDVVVLVAFLALVAAVSLRASRGERTRADYFLAGRSLPWWLVGVSLIASNISTEHFVGMTGTAARTGLAVASYEWLAAPALVFVAWWLLPVFLRAGIFTMPEFLEQRFDRGTRSLMAGLMVVFFVLTVIATVLYSGATFLSGVLDLPGRLEAWLSLEPAAAEALAFHLGVWGIGLAAGIYTVLGGLTAVVWSDLIQGLALLAGGAVVSLLCLHTLGNGAGMLAGWRTFAEGAADQLHVVRPWDDPDVPSLSLVTGLWIPVMFYWGLNQFITQRTLAAGSLAEGQKGVIFAAAIKLCLPFVVVLPGMMALPILGLEVGEAGDDTYPRLLRELLPAGLLGLMLAAVTGAILSTFNSALNSAATVFTLDLWSVHVRPGLSEEGAVRVGRWATLVLAVLACLWAPVIRSFDGVFTYIQELWGFVSAPTCAVFFVGLKQRRVPAAAARAAFLVGPLLYLVARLPSWIWTPEEAAAAGGAMAALHAFSSMAFLYHMAVLFLVLVAMMTLWGKWRPLPEPVELPDRAVVELEPARGVKPAGVAVLAATAALYGWFW